MALLSHFVLLKIGPLDDVSQSPNHKEETMKKFIYITVAFILMLISIGCATLMYDPRKDVGNSQFVGSSNNLDARDMMKGKWW
jgi:hypothetical protein